MRRRPVIAVALLVAALLGGAVSPSAAVEPTGSISGDVTGPDGSYPEHWGVNLFSYVESTQSWDVVAQLSAYEGYQESVWNVFVGSHYEFTGLPAGTYALCVGSLDLPALAEQCYGDTSRPGVSQKVVVGSGETVSDIDFALYVGGTISGRITNWGGGGFQYVVAEAYYLDPDTDLWRRAGLKSSGATVGSYVISGLRTGNYRVFLNADVGYDTIGEYYPNTQDVEQAVDIAVVAGHDTSPISARVYPTADQQTTTTISLSSSTAAELALSVTATASVTSIGSQIVPDGSVQFSIDGTPWGAPVAVTAGAASIALPTTMAFGAHSVTAAFTGTASEAFFLPSTSTAATLSIARSAQSTSTKISATGARVGSRIYFTYTVTVTGARYAPSGFTVLSVGSGYAGKSVVPSASGRTSTAVFVWSVPFTKRVPVSARFSNIGAEDYSYARMLLLGRR